MRAIQNPTEQAFTERLIEQRVFSPAAREMDLQEVIDQHNEVNCLAVGDDDFMIHPELRPTTITTANGPIPGWTLRSNPNAKCDTPNVHRLRGTSRISRDLGRMLGLRVGLNSTTRPTAQNKEV